MTVLRGPADADHYRVKVGRYGDRWYTDPLPTCPIAEQSDWQGPSWSIVKGAAGKDWSWTTNKRNGYTDPVELVRIAALPEASERAKAFYAINDKGLDQAKGRGTIVHWWAEDFLAGRGPRIITDPMLFAAKIPKASRDEATEYLESLAAFFDHYQPEVIAAEYVAIHRTLNGYGYGCTPDVVARVQGQIVGIDWKSRGADSDHGAYPEEAAQIAAGAKADYMIVTDPDSYNQALQRAIRTRIPQIDCGIVVSIKPDGHRIYPTDIDLGFNHVEAMHAFWVARLSERDAVGKPWPPTPTKEQQCQTKNSSPRSATSTTSESSSDTRSTDSTTQPNSSTTPPENSATRSPSSPTPATPDDLTTTARILADAMLEWSPELRQYLKDWWPTDCPNPGQVRRGDHTWTDAQLKTIEQLCDLGDAPFWQAAELARRGVA